MASVAKVKEQRDEIMRKEYAKELMDMKEKMVKAELFAAKLPIFADRILNYKITGEEEWVKFGERYKQIPLGWGINRGFYRNGSNRYVMNCPKDREYSCHLFSIYINTISLFDLHQEFGLDGYLKEVDVFFADAMNTTFYVTDENIEPFLEALNTWYIAAMEKLKEYRLKEEQDDLEKRLAEIKQRQAS